MNVRVLFVRDLALILDMTESGVRKMHARGDLPLRRFGRKLGILESEFIEWARLRRVMSEEPSTPGRSARYVELLRRSRRRGASERHGRG